MPKKLVLPGDESFLPHLACDAGEIIPYGDDYVAFPKVDGVRGLIRKGGLVGRSLDPFRNKFVTARFSHPSLMGMDGELILGWNAVAPDLVGLTTGALNSFEGEPDVRFLVFDLLSPDVINETYATRLAELSHRVQKLREAGYKDTIQIMHHTPIRNATDAVIKWRKWEGMGFEGAIIRRLSALHKNGRATLKEAAFLRCKSFIDFEITVDDILPGKTNTNKATLDTRGYTKRSTSQSGMVESGQAGALIGRAVADVLWNGKLVVKAGQKIKAGPGNMPHAERVAVLASKSAFIGKMATIKFMPYGTREAPRFPVFRSWRIDL